MLIHFLGFLVVSLNAKNRYVYSVVGAGSFTINGFYFPVIGETYKYAMESGYPHGKQWLIEGWTNGDDFYWTIGNGQSGTIFYVISVPQLLYPPVQGWQHVEGFLGIHPGPVILNVNQKGPSMLSITYYNLRNYEFANKASIGPADRATKEEASVLTEGFIDRNSFAATEDVEFMWRNAYKVSSLPCPLPTLVWSRLMLQLARAYCDQVPFAYIHRGLPMSCCDVYPTSFPFKEGMGEIGAPFGYFSEKPIKHGQVVYVAALDLNTFVNDIFIQLPSSHRIVVVTGQEDIGVPVELWNGSSRAANPQVWAGQAGGFFFNISYNEFIDDPRLEHWFVQNLDIEGCGYYTCGEQDPRRLEQIRRKVTPIPIGLDFHTAWQTFGSMKPCHQHLIFDDIRSRAPLWTYKQPAIAISFGTRGKGVIHNDIMPDREAAHKALRAMDAQIVHFLPMMDRNQFWVTLGKYKFAAVAQGHGMDTHRLWEALSLGVVPVLLHSPLDRLLHDFPCIIIDRWTDISRRNIKRWIKRIVQRFGPEPFTMHVRQRLTTGYWVGRIHFAADSIVH